MDFPNDDFVSQRRHAQAELTNITTQQQQVGVIAERVEEQVCWLCEGGGGAWCWMGGEWGWGGCYDCQREY